jgi:hypothetical protein
MAYPSSVELTVRPPEVTTIEPFDCLGNTSWATRSPRRVGDARDDDEAEQALAAASRDGIGVTSLGLAKQ